MQYFFGAVFFLLSGAAFGAPATFTYQGRIVGTNGVPLETSNVAFEFTITNPTGTCVVYREQKAGLDMRNSKGVFDTPIGSGSKYFPTSTTVGLLEVFNNSTTLDCEGGGTYTPVVDDGRLLRVQFFDGVAWRLITPDNIIRSVPFSSYANTATKALKLGSNVATDFVLKSAIPVCTAGYVLTSNASGVLICTPDTGGAAGVVNSIAGSGAITVTENTPGSGVYILTITTGTTAGTVVAGNDTRLSDSRPPNGAASGDLTGNYPAPTIAANAVTSAKILDGTIGLTDFAAAAGAGQIFRYDGTAWTYAKPVYTDLVNGSGLSPWPASSCAAGSFLTWSSTSDAFECTSLTSSMVTTALGFAPAPTTWTTSGSDVYRSSGNVGIQTTAPTFPLDINGKMRAYTEGGGGYIYSDTYRNNQLGGGFYLRHARGTLSTPAALNLGDTNQIYFANHDGTGFRDSAGIQSVLENAASPFETALAFQTRGSSGLKSRLHITGEGKVGIGTTTPVAILNIQSPALDSTVLRVNSSGGQNLLNVRETSTGEPAFSFNSNAGDSRFGYSDGSAWIGGSSSTILTIRGAASGSNFSVLSLGSTEATNKNWQFSHKDAAGSLNYLSLEYYNGSTWTNPVSFLPSGVSSFNGKVGIGVTAPSEMLEVNGSVKATSFVMASDRRLKEGIAPAPGYETIKNLEGVQYNWKANGQHDMGLIAQEVEKVFPFAVATDPKTGLKGVRYQSLISPMINSIKETHVMCEEMQSQVVSLTLDRDRMQNEIDELKKMVQELASEKKK